MLISLFLKGVIMVLALIIVACILLLLAAIGWPAVPNVSVGWLGMFFFALSFVWNNIH